MSYFAEAIHRAIFDELSELEVNNVGGTVALSAEVRIPLELPDGWEFEYGNDEYVEMTITKEFDL